MKNFYACITITCAALLTGLSISAQAQSISSSQIDDILDRYDSSARSLAIGYCFDARKNQSYSGERLKASFLAQQNKTVKEYNRGSYAEASAGGTAYAKAIGFCYGQSDQSQRALYASALGSMLSAYALGASNTGAPIGTSTPQVKEALTLLEFAKQRGQMPGGFNTLMDKFRISEESLPSSANGDYINVSADTLNSEYSSNKLRLKRNYDGKLLEVSGIVQSIRERSNGKIIITYKTYPSYLLCKIDIASSSVDKALNLNSGDRLTVRGRMKMKLENKLLSLESCTL